MAQRPPKPIAALLSVLGVLLFVPFVLPGVALAAEPDQVQITLEGCKLPDAASTCVYPDDFTTGSLGKNWAELDLVPHRLTLDNSGADQTFEIRLSADHLLGAVKGYDFITTPTATGTGCTMTVGSENDISPTGVVGGVDKVITTLLQIHMDVNGTCSITYAERLALGSHLYSGASLQSQVLNTDHSSTGQRTVSIPVNEIAPQEINKTAMAFSTPTYTWTIGKSSPTEQVDLDSCLPAPTQPNVSYTVSYTRTKVAGNTLTVNGTITLTNPAHRPLVASVTDTIELDGNPVGGGTLPDVTVPAGDEVDVPYSFSIPNGTGTLANTASAVYHDPDLPGVDLSPLTATVAVPISPTELPGTGATATITDTETASSGLLYSRTSPHATSGFVVTDSFSDPATDSGSISISKIVKAAAPGNFDGTLVNDVSLDPAGDATAITATASVPIHVHAANPTLTVNKHVDVAPATNADFPFTITNDQTSATTQVTVTILAGQTSGSATATVAPSTDGYTLTEGTPPQGYSAAAPVTTSVLALCDSGTVRVDNLRSRAALTITKTVSGDQAPPAGFVFHVSCADGTTATLTFHGSGSQSVAGIQTGTSCDVSEDAAPGWTSAPSGTQTVTVTGQNATVSFTNTRNTGSVSVTKAVEGDDAPAAGFVFAVTCTDGTNAVLTFTQAGTKTVDDILSGSTCTVTETPVDGWTSLPAEPQTVTLGLADGATGTVSFTNTRNLGSVSVTKVVEGDDAPAAGFMFAVSCSDGTEETLTFTEAGTQTVDGILSGSTCTITENAAEGWDPTPGEPQAVTLDLADGATATVSFTNTRQPAGLELMKTVDRTSASFGDTLTYGLTVTNIATRPLHAVEVSDPVPDGTTYVAGSATCPSPCTASYDADTDTVHYAVGDLGAGESFAGMAFKVTIDQSPAAADGAIPSVTIVNSGTTSSPPDITTPAPSNEVRTVVTAVLGVKITLPVTGVQMPLRETVTLAFALVVCGAVLTAAGRRRVRPIEIPEGGDAR